MSNTSFTQQSYFLISKMLSTSSFVIFGLPIHRAVGHKMYGTQYREKLSETIRRAAEFCDCLQCFFVLHSMGGGKEETGFFLYMKYDNNPTRPVCRDSVRKAKCCYHTIQIRYQSQTTLFATVLKEVWKFTVNCLL